MAVREATDDEIAAVHTRRHLHEMDDLAGQGREALRDRSKDDDV